MNAGSINKVTDLVTTRIGDSSVAQSVVAKMKDRFRDYIIPQKEIKLGYDRFINEAVFVDSYGHWQPNVVGHPVNNILIGDHAHNQIAMKMGISWSYYNRMKNEAPELLVDNVNHWLRQDVLDSKGDVTDKKFLIRSDWLGFAPPQPIGYVPRTYSKVRAFLSDRYKIINHIDVVNETVPVLDNLGLDIVSGDITEERMYIKAVSKKITAEVQVGDVVGMGIGITNSEIGLSALDFRGFIETLVCSNGMTTSSSDDRSFSRKHLGVKLTNTAQLSESNGTNELLEYADQYIRQTCNLETLQRHVLTMRNANDYSVKNVPALLQYIKRIDSNVTFSDKDLEQIEQHTAVTSTRYGHKVPTLYDVANGITRMAEDQKSYNRSSDLEKFGYTILDLGQANNHRKVNRSQFGEGEDSVIEYYPEQIEISGERNF